MEKLRTSVTAAMGVILMLVLYSCAPGMKLVPKSADPAELTGTYTLILYGCRYADDLENIALIVDEKSGYSVDIYALEAMYKVKKELSGSQALSEAEAFVRCSMPPVWKSVVRRISDDLGKTIAYEIKPLYRDLVPQEALVSSYSLKDMKVTAYFTLDPSHKRDILRLPSR